MDPKNNPLIFIHRFTFPEILCILYVRSYLC